MRKKIILRHPIDEQVLDDIINESKKTENTKDINSIIEELSLLTVEDISYQNSENNQKESGAEEIQQMMRDFRANPPKEIAGSKVVVIKDYQTLVERNVMIGEESKLQFPTTSNVLQYFTEDGTKVSVRPSGTEPKIKFYVEVRGKMQSRADFARCEAEATAKIDAVRASLGV